MRGRLTQIRQKYAPALDIDDYVSKEEEKLSIRQEEADKKLSQALGELHKVQDLYRDAEEKLNDTEGQLALAREDAVLMDYGYYEPNYNFESSGQWEKYLSDVNDQLKLMIGNVEQQILRLSLGNLDIKEYLETKCAGHITQAVTFNNSEREGIRMQTASIKLILRAFNGECDGFIAKVNYKNIELMMKRIEASYTAICKIGERSNMVTINEMYKDLKKTELCQVHEYQEWKQREKEEQARIREQMREEERADREMAKAQKEAEKEFQRNAAALVKARIDVEGANETQKEKLFAQIAELEKRVEEMEEKNRYISQAMLTKTGHVYIISNVGSFGDDMLKIGMTRRLEPMDRVKELGDASVPFPFDVHAMIRTSDAPSLENALHKHFDARRVNLENNRKEFFYVTLDEIQRELDALKDELNIEADIHITMAAEAKQWRMSKARRHHLEQSYEG